MISKGKCCVCGAVISKNLVTKHLESCKRPGKGTSQKAFRILVEGYPSSYWMHIEASAAATLEDLDSFLRDIWLECCGHLSAFTIEGNTYASEVSEEMDESMNIKLSEVLCPGLKFSYEYDFGTTTELSLKILSEGESEIVTPITLLVMNEPPFVECDSCKKQATQSCSECVYEGKGALCEECAEKHECGEDMLLPVVNSPRSGMCGYTG